MVKNMELEPNQPLLPVSWLQRKATIPTMVKLAAAALCLALASTADAFKPTAFVSKKISTPSLSNDWRPGMKMVAGGAERAYGDDYYEGKLPSSLLRATTRRTCFTNELSCYM